MSQSIWAHQSRKTVLFSAPKLSIFQHTQHVNMTRILASGSAQLHHQYNTLRERGPLEEVNGSRQNWTTLTPPSLGGTVRDLGRHNQLLTQSPKEKGEQCATWTAQQRRPMIAWSLKNPQGHTAISVVN